MNDIYRLEALNIQQSSTNKIHDDNTASTLGFRGGLVPGIEIFSYMTHFSVKYWGLSWLEGGGSSITLRRPVYDGKIATLKSDWSGGDSFNVTLDSDDETCATGTFERRSSMETGDLGNLERPPVAKNPPPVEQALLKPGSVFSSHPILVTPKMAAAYLSNVKDGHDIYRTHSIVHPGIILRFGNLVLGDNIVMNAWIHTSSRLMNIGYAYVGDELQGFGKLLRKYENNGHRYADLDVYVFSNNKCVARIIHSVIYYPRQLKLHGLTKNNHNIL